MWPLHFEVILTTITSSLNDKNIIVREKNVQKHTKTGLLYIQETIN